MLLALGDFVFSIEDLLFKSLSRKRGWRHPSNDRVGARPASQFAGPGDDIINLPGLLAPGQIGRREALDDIAAMAEAGRPYVLLDGEGYVYGSYVITDLDEDKRVFMAGGLAMAIDFLIALKRVDDEEGETGAAGSTVRRA